MPTRLEIWRELGKKFGVPPQGSPEYEHKKEIYKRALAELPITDEVTPAPVQMQSPSFSPCICPCNCHAQRLPMQSMGTVHAVHSTKRQERRVYSESDSESDFERPPPRPRRAPAIKRQPVSSSSSSESSSESDEEPPARKKGAPKKTATADKKSTAKNQKANSKSRKK